jgi:molybdopterin-containing oxidoreductase family iron-sulfur binding subunit
MDRREFLKTGGMFMVGTSCASGLYLLAAAAPSSASTTSKLAGRRWGMIIDIERCSPDCTACLEACRHENNVAYHGDERWDIHWIRKVEIKSKDPHHPIVKSVPLLCNHCDNPPCAQVCPIQATYKREDGIVIIDHHRCMGCRYCLIACPYNARYFNFKENEDWSNKKYPKRSHGVAESCHFCAPRLDAGKIPACVEACRRVNAGALIFGDLNDRHSEISRLIADKPVKRIREDLHTEPKVFYIGL